VQRAQTPPVERLHYDEITLKGIFHFTPRDVKEAFLLLREKRIDVKQLITATCSLKEVPSVFPLLAKGKGIKYAVVP
jgi:L-iditol 2-dehydrogenase